MKLILIMLLKFVSCYIAFSIGLDLFFKADFAEIFIFSLTLTAVSFFIGDRILLPRVGNSNGLVIDFFLAYTSVWVFGSTVLNSYLQIAWGSIISALLITGAEALIHRYMLKNVKGKSNEGLQKNKQRPKLAYRLEMANQDQPIKKE